MQLSPSAHRKQSLANIGASQNLHTLLSRVRSEILLPFPPFTVAPHWRHFHFISPSSLSVAWRGVWSTNHLRAASSFSSSSSDSADVYSVVTFVAATTAFTALQTRESK